MPIPRFTLSSSKLHSTCQALTLLRRSVPSKAVQSVSFTNYTRHGGKTKHDLHPRFSAEESHSSRPSRSWGTYGIRAAVLGFAGLAAFLHYNDERAVPKDHQGKPIIGGPFTLVNTEEQTVTEQAFLGKWVLLYFGYTSSPDIGPEQVQLMAKLTDRLESHHNIKILPVFVTVDPERDTPSQLGAYLKEFDSRIIGLTGPVAAVRQMAQEYGVYFEKVGDDGDDYLVDLPHDMFILKRNMEVAVMMLRI